MAAERRLYVGPSLRRLRRDLGLTQADMAADLDISAPYVALLERNQRPVTAEMLLRLARTYKIDLADLAGDGGADHTARMQAVLKEPAVVKRWEEIGAEPSTMTPTEVTRFVQEEIDKWTPVVKSSGAKPE